MPTLAHSAPHLGQLAGGRAPIVGSTGSPGPELPPRNNSTSLRRALRVLDAVSHHRGQPGGISLTSLAEAVEMSKSTVLRLIAPLRDEGLIHQDRDSGRYRLGPAAVRLGAAFVERVDLGALAVDLLRDLARRVGESATLVVPGQPEWAVRTAGTVVLQALGASGDDIATGPTSWAAASIRDRGWWAQIDEVGAGRGTVAAPVLDHRSRVVAAVESRFPAATGAHRCGVDAAPNRTAAVGDLARECADALSERLGAPRRESEPPPRPTPTPTTPNRAA